MHNVVHHMTLALPTITAAESVGYFLCWSIHLFPLLQYVGIGSFVGTVGKVGNFAPFVAAVYLFVTGGVASLPAANKAILLQMMAYRCLYMNATFGVWKDIFKLDDSAQELL